MKRYEAVRAVKTQVVDALGEEMADRRDEISAILGDLQKQICRDMILKEGRRIDNRRFDEIRPIYLRGRGAAPAPRQRVVHPR
jgi:polyribonucleotide nucleotidyltransferase